MGAELDFCVASSCVTQNVASSRRQWVVTSISLQQPAVDTELQHETLTESAP